MKFGDAEVEFLARELLEATETGDDEKQEVVQDLLAKAVDRPDATIRQVATRDEAIAFERKVLDQVGAALPPQRLMIEEVSVPAGWGSFDAVVSRTNGRTALEVRYRARIDMLPRAIMRLVTAPPTFNRLVMVIHEDDRWAEAVKRQVRNVRQQLKARLGVDVVLMMWSGNVTAIVEALVADEIPPEDGAFF